MGGIKLVLSDRSINSGPFDQILIGEGVWFNQAFRMGFDRSNKGILIS